MKTNIQIPSQHRVSLDTPVLLTKNPMVIYVDRQDTLQVGNTVDLKVRSFDQFLKGSTAPWSRFYSPFYDDPGQRMIYADHVAFRRVNAMLLDGPELPHLRFGLTFYSLFDVPSITPILTDLLELKFRPVDESARLHRAPIGSWFKRFGIYSESPHSFNPIIASLNQPAYVETDIPSLLPRRLLEAFTQRNSQVWGDLVQLTGEEPKPDQVAITVANHMKYANAAWQLIKQTDVIGQKKALADGSVERIQVAEWPGVHFQLNGLARQRASLPEGDVLVFSNSIRTPLVFRMILRYVEKHAINYSTGMPFKSNVELSRDADDASSLLPGHNVGSRAGNKGTAASFKTLYATAVPEYFGPRDAQLHTDVEHLLETKADNGEVPLDILVAGGINA